MMAGIDENITIHTYEGNRKVGQTMPKYELVSSHCGSRTFCTLSLEQGMRPETVMKFSGHKTLLSFQKYIKIPMNVYKREMMEAWSK